MKPAASGVLIMYGAYLRKSIFHINISDSTSGATTVSWPSFDNDLSYYNTAHYSLLNHTYLLRICRSPLSPFGS